MNEPVVDWRCGMLDVLEAAALEGGEVEVCRGKHWQRVQVSDVVSDRGEDWLVSPAGERLAVGELSAVRRPRP